jgi:hypothetical protein
MAHRSASLVGAPLCALALGAVACGPPSPSALANATKWPVALAADASSLYWLDVDGSVWKVAKAGGTATPLASALHPLASGEVPYLDGFSLAVDAEAVWFTTFEPDGALRAGQVWKLPHGGTPQLLASWPGEPAYLAVDADGVYVAHNPYSDLPGQLQRVARDGSGTPTLLATGLVWPHAVASDATNVYFLARGVNPGAAGNGTLGAVPKAGGDAKTLLGGLRTPQAMQLADGLLYVLDDGSHLQAGSQSLYNSDGTIAQLDVATGAAHQVVTGIASRPAALAVQGGAVFFLDSGVWQAARNGADWDVVALSSQLGTGQTGLVADADAVYWIGGGTSAGGTSDSVWKLPR